MDWALWIALPLVAAQGVTCWLIIRRLPTVARVDQRLTHIYTALSLLTDTTESGLRDTIAELERLSRTGMTPPPRRQAAVRRRVKSMASRGRTVREIAVSEGLAEGEVGLRLTLDPERLSRSEAAVP
jgi:hypothetical protein